MLQCSLPLRCMLHLARVLSLVGALTALCANPALAQTPSALPAGGWVQIDESLPGLEPPNYEISASALSSISLSVATGGFEVKARYHSGDKFQRLSLLGESFTSEVGKPELPVVRVMLAIPDCESYSLQVELGDSTDYSGATVWPVPGHAVGYEDEYQYVYEVFAIDEASYQDDALYPNGAAIIAEDGWVRDQRYVILELHPILYNPALSLLRCYSSLSVDIRFENPVETNIRGVGPLEAACRSVIANYDGIGTVPLRGGRSDSCDVSVHWCTTVDQCSG